MKRIALTLIAASLSGAAAAAAAAPLNEQQILQQFNLVTLGNVTSYSHVDGRSYVGGSLTGYGAVFAMHPSEIAPSTYAGLTVAGSASGLQVTDYGAAIGGSLSNSTVNKGTSYVGGSASGSNFNGAAYVAGATSGVNFNGGKLSSVPSTATAATSTNFSTTLKSLSSSLASLKSTGSTVAFNGGKATFNAVADANGLAVFDLSASNLDAQVFAKGEFEFNLGSAKTVIINVDELSVTSNANFLGGSAQKIANNVIWNFYNATDITLNSQFGGSILATSANLTNYNNIEGAVLVNTLTQRGEIHANQFAGNVSAVPEPESYALMLGGLALMAGIARRRRAA